MTCRFRRFRQRQLKTEREMSKRCYVDNAYNRRVGRVGKPIGSHVISRDSASSGSSSSRSSCSSRSTASDQSSDVVYVKGYTRSDGTYVAPHTRSNQGASVSSSYSSCAAPTTSSSRVYVDNAYNRKLGRVGKPHGTHVVSRTTGSEYYSDNPDYWSLDHVETPTTRRVNHHQRENHAVMQVRGILEGMAISDESRRDHDHSYGYQQQQDLAEERRRVSAATKLSTDVPCLDDRASPHNRSQLIPYGELVLKQEIGRGGFGVVRADQWHDSAIAFKRLNCSQLSNRQLKSFLREVTILSSLDHPHTVKLLGAVAESSCVGFVMEQLRRSLFKAIFVDENVFTTDKKKDIISQTADALVYLHDNKRIAHCDIKSENILLDSNDDVKLADFGLSTVKSVTETTQSVRAGQGTPRYSAPEILRGDLLSKSQMFPTDIYSLAIVVFEVFTEEEPFDGLNQRQLERHVGEGDHRPSSENKPLDDSVEELLHECWDKVASKRPEAKEFEEKWRRVMKSSTIHSRVTVASADI